MLKAFLEQVGVGREKENELEGGGDWSPRTRSPRTPISSLPPFFLPMWIYSFISSHLSNILLPPPGEPTPYPPPPSEATPAPYRFPVLDPSSTEHNPLSFHEQRPVGTFVKKKTKEMEKQEMEEFNRRLKEKRNPKRPGQSSINPPRPLALSSFPSSPQPVASFISIRRRANQHPYPSTLQKRSRTSTRRYRE